MEQSILRRYQSLRLPRYTSYPTAPHFQGPVDVSAGETWLSGATDDPVSVYLHVPYCRQLCWYCGCNMRATQRDEPLQRYARALEREMLHVGGVLGRRPRLGHVHWGGGTPHVLDADDLRRIDATLRSVFTTRDGAPEVAMEIDARTLTDDAVAAFVDIGVTRASLGVQSFENQVQEAINRIQSVAQTAAAIDAVRRVGIDAVNVDLVYGLPYETVESVRETVSRCLDWQPNRFAVFGYAHLPSVKQHQRLIDTASLPDGEARIDQEAAITEVLLSAGYVPVGIDHFARPDDPMAKAATAGTLRRNFQGYTTDPCPTLIGFGASSIGRIGHRYLQNETDLPAYLKAVDGGRVTVARTVEIDAEDRLRGTVIEALMCSRPVDLAEVSETAGCDRAHFADLLPRLDALAADGLLHRDGWRIQVCDDARPLTRVVAAVFDRHLDPAQGRHAVAV